jgi:serine/threonine-protein kinase
VRACERRCGRDARAPSEEVVDFRQTSDERRQYQSLRALGVDELRGFDLALPFKHLTFGRPVLELITMTVSSAAMPLTPGTRLGRYEIRSRIGAGGMGEVYLAQDLDLDRPVAIKLLLTEVTENPQHLRRFKQEARAASALNHPNILIIHEIGQTESASFIVTEFIEGVTLRQRMASGQMDLSAACDVAIQIASALAAAHAAGIVHRDIKPENIMLRHDGYVKVLDFGIAILVKNPEQTVDPEALTRDLIDTGPGRVVGTPDYMSPEQTRGQATDRRTDIWSLGVVLYEMVAGRAPFEGETASDILASILMVEPPQLRQFSPAVPAYLESIVTKALAKNRAQRYQTIEDLLVDLQLFEQQPAVGAELERFTQPRARTAAASGVGRASLFTGGASGIILGRTSVSSPRQHHKVIDSLAILPLVNATADPNTEYLSDGITDSIINTLSQVTKLRVMARSTVFRYKGRDVDPQEVGRELNVRAVMIGKVLQVGTNLIIKAELVDVEDGSHLWGEQYHRQPSDILIIQEEIAGEITQKLQLKLSGEQQKRLNKRHTDNSKAYQLYLKARYFWNKRTEEGFKKSIGYFNQAIEEDPGYALAYVGLADSYDMLGVYSISPPREALSRAKAAAEKALEIDFTLPEAHTSLAKVRMAYDWDWLASETEFKRAIDLAPTYAPAHHWYALHLMAMERFDEASTQLKLAQELEPLSLSINVSIGLPFYWSRRHDQATEQFKKTLEMDQTFSLGHVLLGQAYVQMGMHDEAIAELQEARRLDNTPQVKAILGYAYAVSGRNSEALRMLTELDQLAACRYVSPYFRALIYAGLGEKTQAFAWLDKAYEERNEWLVWLKVDPKLDSLRADPRFADLLHRVGFAP